MWREKDMIPLNIFSAIRWVGASSCPLSHAYGQPGERFAMLEPTSSHGTSTFSCFFPPTYLPTYSIAPNLSTHPSTHLYSRLGGVFGPCDGPLDPDPQQGRKLAQASLGM